MKDIINHLIAHHTLSTSQAEEVLSNIANGQYNDIEIASFLTVFLMRNITVNELKGFRNALMKHALKVDLQQENLIDLCGTGGDGKDTFNISTAASFIVAGTGAKVAKHGNYGVSSSCGSSNILSYLGYQFTASEQQLRDQLNYTNICFLHAPLFNPAMKHVAPVRKAMRIKTFFNMLGPMVNPATPNKQLVGVFSLHLARLYQYIYQQGNIQYTIVHSLDGYDEVSLTGPIKLINNHGEQILDPIALGTKRYEPIEIHGGKTIKESAKIFINTLAGNGTRAQEDVVITNAALALQSYYNIDFIEAKLRARESMYSGKALKALNQLIETSKKQVQAA